ncbi:MAG TPA: hypothetical protein VGN12_16880 [Pirellulales bacterium]|jgi:hypothetical protein
MKSQARLIRRYIKEINESDLDVTAKARAVEPLVSRLQQLEIFIEQREESRYISRQSFAAEVAGIFPTFKAALIEHGIPESTINDVYQTWREAIDQELRNV